jgi:antibiotic biosynthesis monooxygenase (ABM) superfamily enzyme
MLLFRSEEHLDRWLQSPLRAAWGEGRGEGLRGALLSLETAWKLAKAWFDVDRRLPEWRRRTADEIRELFDNLGLTGDFWRLT